MDLVVIPFLCLSLWGGTCLGTWLVGPIRPKAPKIEPPEGLLSFRLGPIEYRSPIVFRSEPETPEKQARRLHIDLAAFGPSLWAVGGLLFAISGYTMSLSACGRYRWRVLGLAVFVTLVQFLINVVGQMWDVLEPLRPWTIFYYYQPQEIILGKPWPDRVAGVGGAVRRRGGRLRRGVLGVHAAGPAGAPMKEMRHRDTKVTRKTKKTEGF